VIEISLLLVVLSIIIILGGLLGDREVLKNVLTSLFIKIMFVATVIGVVIMLSFAGYALDYYF